MSATEAIFVEVEGIRLRVFAAGPENGRTPALLLHGFTGSAESMACVSEPLSRDRRVFRLDLVGHGESDAPANVEPYAMDACVSQVLSAIGELGIDRPHLIGYSMGGRTALSLAVTAADQISSLTLVGATAGIADDCARSTRIEADEALANRIETEGLQRFVDHWMALPLFASQACLGEAALARARAVRMRNRPHGLANSLRGMGAGAQAPLLGRLDRVTLPVMLVVGERDQKFRGIAAELASSLPDSSTEIVRGVGHAAHLEDPAGFNQLIHAFFAQQESR